MNTQKLTNPIWAMGAGGEFCLGCGLVRISDGLEDVLDLGAKTATTMLWKPETSPNPKTFGHMVMLKFFRAARKKGIQGSRLQIPHRPFKNGSSPKAPKP